ncbi:hypothetical protein KKA00_09260 [bacterium]|nr:hypothetical protein [bacterium]MBU1652397.1 hypothetical protein [bacterium]
MLRNILFWILAVIITLGAAVYQKKTGPTYPVSGSVEIDRQAYPYELIRSHGGETDAQISITVSDTDVSGLLIYKRFNVEENWTTLTMMREGDNLQANLPHQPPAGKLQYVIRLRKGAEEFTVPADQVPVIRFKGAVPITILLPHILFIFTAMLVSTRAGLEALAKNGKPRNYALWAAGLLFLGGMVFGPIVQKYAFGAYWTGIPWGWDLTDNKTLIAMIGWIIAVIAGRKDKSARGWVISASVLLLLIFSIPHSMMGSELDYGTGEVGSSSIQQ